MGGRGWGEGFEGVISLGDEVYKWYKIMFWKVLITDMA